MSEQPSPHGWAGKPAGMWCPRQPLGGGAGCGTWRNYHVDRETATAVYGRCTVCRREGWFAKQQVLDDQERWVKDHPDFWDGEPPPRIN